MKVKLKDLNEFQLNLYGVICILNYKLTQT